MKAAARALRAALRVAGNGSGLALAALLALSLLPAAAPAQSAYRSGFDHFTTGWPLDGAHRRVDCETCHVGGVFEGTPRQCVACHSQAGLVKATPTPLEHIRTTTQCQDCHRDASWVPVLKIDHTQVLGSCRSCHNNTDVAGKPQDHPTSSNDCQLCHRTNTWLIITSNAIDEALSWQLAALAPTGRPADPACPAPAGEPAADCR